MSILAFALIAILFLYARPQTATGTFFVLPRGSLKAPSKGNPGYRSYMRDMRRA